ncbi:MAG: ribosome biogenesis GTPase Der [Alphaproteobacteria bacterium]|nr:ribosome biogenesis GTPase Der [Alphaproteobacteria bacterium]
MSVTVSIIGRPNVGKSTLFNRLTGKKQAIVHEMPGVTRDRREGDASLLGIDFKVIDTAGMEEGDEGSLEHGMFKQTERALEESDVALFLFDIRAGVTPLDAHFADIIRKSKTPVILVANKCEGSIVKNNVYEGYSLGLGDPVVISAEHAEGMMGLFEALEPFIRTKSDEIEDAEEEESPLQLAIVGRPNVGKSTLVNSLLRDERLLTGPEAGVTRDSIAVDWEWKGRKIRLVDTAGLRRRAKITCSVEKMSASNAIKVIDMAQVVILMLEPDGVLDKQDLVIAKHVLDEGRALIIAINKWDTATNKNAVLQKLKGKLMTSLNQVQGIHTITLSALKGQGNGKLMQAVFDVYELWNKRIPTAQLNRWLDGMTERHAPPLGSRGRHIRMRYITQAKARPPTFAIFTNNPENLPKSYTRYLIKGLRESFGLKGVPLRINLKKGKNPYSDK